MTVVTDERGQAAVELVAAVPILAVAVALIAQLSIAGYALWAAGSAASAGARAATVGGEATRAARSALPGWLEDGARVGVGERVRVRVEAPALVPAVPAIPLTASSGIPEAG